MEQGSLLLETDRAISDIKKDSMQHEQIIGIRIFAERTAGIHRNIRSRRSGYLCKKIEWKGGVVCAAEEDVWSCYLCKLKCMKRWRGVFAAEAGGR